MSNQAIIALSEIVESLSVQEQAYLCDGDTSNAVAWSPRTEITVRLSAKADDEIWLIAGSGILVRFVAASDGDFGDVVEVAQAILRGEALEAFGNSDASPDDHAIPSGYRIGPAGGFSGGLQVDAAAWVGRLAGPFAF